MDPLSRYAVLSGAGNLGYQGSQFAILTFLINLLYKFPEKPVSNEQASRSANVDLKLNQEEIGDHSYLLD